jgi:poly [ADP-ribose] polymerase 2/3/4
MSTSSINREAKYIYADVTGNNNKYWNIQELSDASCSVKWGRVGANAQTQTKHFGTQYEASSFFESKCKEKEAKGYEKLKVLDGSRAVTVPPPTMKIEEIATRQIATNSPQTLALVKRLAAANIHDILSVTTLTYDTSRGTFSTPLGIVTQDAIDDARATLTQMVKFVHKGDFKNQNYIKLLNRYLRLVPQKVGQRLDPKTLYPDLDAIFRQNDILDSLEASLKVAVAAPGEVADRVEPRLFEAKINLVEDGKVIDRIRKFYRATRQIMHCCYNLDVKLVYDLEIGPMKKAFEREGTKIGNIMQLWHGTKIGNLLSILKSGYVIPPANAAHCTGRMFGNGVYFSDQSTKSLNYAYGYWSGSREKNCFMLLNDVAMGKYYVPSSHGEGLPKSGYDSTFAKANRSGVINNEMIVYRTVQINPRFLIEFSPRGR